MSCYCDVPVGPITMFPDISIVPDGPITMFPDMSLVPDDLIKMFPDMSLVPDGPDASGPEFHPWTTYP